MSNAALILCGGFSERMGQDKASLAFGNQSLLARITGIVGSCVDEVHLVARTGQELPANEALGLPVARDPAEGNGPLAGLAAGLDAIASEKAFVVSCDVPLLQASLVAGLLDAAHHVSAVIPHVEGHYMTTCAVYAKSLTDEINAMLARGERRPRAIAQLDGARVVDEAFCRDLDPKLSSFVDCNTPERLNEALALAGISTSR
jgi:molybdopterin-guanine dinucleotide biosynthesis protein A